MSGCGGDLESAAALFGPARTHTTSDDNADDEVFKLGAVVETAGGTVLVTEEGARVGLAPLAAPPEAAPPKTAPVDAFADVSTAHRVGTEAAWQEPLAAALDELETWDRSGARLRALLHARPVKLGEWFAEHARMQLAPGSGCTSRPLWLAWMGTALGDIFVVLWAADERAARRAVLELRLGRAAWPFLAPRPLPFRPPCFGVLVVGARLRSLLSSNY